MSEIRIEKLTLKDFKNVRFGTFTMPSFLNKETFCSDILGIYGQNGSGKTAVIDAFKILQTLLSGESLEKESGNLVNVDSDNASISLGFSLDDDMYKYTLVFARRNGKGGLSSELLEVKKRKEDGTFEREKAVLGYDYVNREIKPGSTFKRLIKGNRDLELDLLVAARMAKKEETSLLFSSDGLCSFKDKLNDDILDPLRKIRDYAEANLIVFSTRDLSITPELKMKFTYRKEEMGHLVKGQIPISLDKPSVFSEEEKNSLEHMLKSLNTVLSLIVPHLELGLYTAGEELTDSGKKGYLVEIVSLKNGKAIPLRYESEGILKIISLSNLLLCVYNNPGVCLIVDEFDASVFEYLLGEIISIFSKGAKGQMIFTSHNLRILEMIDKDSVIFSTANPDNRYIRMTNIKSTNNLRDVYIRSILLGGMKENIYEETDSQEISMALRRAWRDGKE